MTQLGLGHDERYGISYVMVRTFVGAWQPVCDESGLAINVRPEIHQGGRNANDALNGFVKAAKAFSGWWERPEP